MFAYSNNNAIATGLLRGVNGHKYFGKNKQNTRIVFTKGLGLLLQFLDVSRLNNGQLRETRT